MKKILVAYATLTGNTEKMAEYIAEGIRLDGNEAVVKKVKELKKAKALEGYDGYVFGCPTYYRSMMPEMQTFLFLAKNGIVGLTARRTGGTA